MTPERGTTAPLVSVASVVARTRKTAPVSFSADEASKGDDTDAPDDLEEKKKSSKLKGAVTKGLMLGSVLPNLKAKWLSAGSANRNLYTVESLESQIYDNCHHDPQERLLMPLCMLSVDQEMEPPKRILRFTSSKALAASFVCILSVMTTSICTPLTFLWGGSWADPSWIPGGRPVMILDIICDVVFLCFLLLQLNTSYLHPSRRVEVVDRRKILKHRLGSLPWLSQMISVTCYIWIIAFDCDTLINNVKIVRFFHLVFFPDACWLVKDRWLVRILSIPLPLCFGVHWAACIMSWTGGYREAIQSQGPDSLTLWLNGTPVPGKVSYYFTAFVECLFMLLGGMDNILGGGTIRQDNFGALIILSIGAPVGSVIISKFISAVVREEALQFALDIRHEENKAFVKRALQNLNVPLELQKRVFSLHYYQKMSHDNNAFEQLFKENQLSGPLEDAIRVYLYQPVVVHSNFFKGKDSSYILAVVRALQDRVYLPGDYCVRAGEVANEMYFVNKGEVSVLVLTGAHQGSKSVSDAIVVGPRKRRGHHFGEVALIKGSLRTAWVKAETYVVLSCLTRDRIEAIWVYFPEERHAMVEMVTQTMNRDAERRRAASRSSGRSSQHQNVPAENTRQTQTPETKKAQKVEGESREPEAGSTTRGASDQPPDPEPEKGNKTNVGPGKVTQASLKRIESLCKELISGQKELARKQLELEEKVNRLAETTQTSTAPEALPAVIETVDSPAAPKSARVVVKKKLLPRRTEIGNALAAASNAPPMSPGRGFFAKRDDGLHEEE